MTHAVMLEKCLALVRAIGSFPTTIDATPVPGGLNVCAEWNDRETAERFSAAAARFGACDVAHDPDLGWTTLLKLRG